MTPKLYISSYDRRLHKRSHIRSHITFVDCKCFGSCWCNSMNLQYSHHEVACQKPIVPNEQGMFVIVLQFPMIMNCAKVKAATTSQSRRPPQGMSFILLLLQVNLKQEHQLMATLQIPEQQDFSTLTPRHL